MTVTFDPQAALVIAVAIATALGLSRWLRGPRAMMRAGLAAGIVLVLAGVAAGNLVPSAGGIIIAALWSRELWHDWRDRRERS